MLIPPSIRIRSLSTIERTVVALREVAATRGGVFGVDKAAAWLDGFWDFVVVSATRLMHGGERCR
jgi:hypothetical protein